MIYNLETYRHVIKPIIKTWCDNKECKPRECLGELALATSCPIIVVGYFIGELYGFDESLLAQLARLEIFYKIESIEGKLNE